MDITTIPLFLFIYRVQGRALETNVRITDKHLVGPFVWLSYGLLYSMAIPGSDLLEVPIPYILGLFFRPKFQGISPENMAQNMVLTYLHFRILSHSHWYMAIFERNDD